jgi:hypothetical protein
MANIIDYTLFTVDRKLSNTELQALITSFIVRFEPEILKRILGYDLKKAFVDGLAIETPLEKWTNLRDGVDYTDSGIYYQFRGVKDIIAYYVYFKITQEHWDLSTSIGLKSLTSENSVIVDPKVKQARIWNTMLEFNDELKLFIANANTPTEIYPNYDPETIGYLNALNI